MSSGNIGLLCSRSRSQQKFKMAGVYTVRRLEKQAGDESERKLWQMAVCSLLVLGLITNTS